METKKIRVELEEVKVCRIQIDLHDLQNYMDRFLALKNHERNTREILEVSGINDSNCVNVTIMIDYDEDEAKEIERCKDFVGQFGTFTCEPTVETAYILDKNANDINFQLDWKELYLYE